MGFIHRIPDVDDTLIRFNMVPCDGCSFPPEFGISQRKHPLRVDLPVPKEKRMPFGCNSLFQQKRESPVDIAVIVYALTGYRSAGIERQRGKIKRLGKKACIPRSRRSKSRKIASKAQITAGMNQIPCLFEQCLFRCKHGMRQCIQPVVGGIHAAVGQMFKLNGCIQMGFGFHRQLDAFPKLPGP